MKFSIPKIVRTIDLAEYAKEMDGGLVHVWVNPPRSLTGRLSEALVASRKITEALKGGSLLGKEAQAVADDLEALGKDILAVYAELWSAGPEDTRWTVEELTQLIETTQQGDPNFWPWISAKTMTLIAQHRLGLKKA